MFKPGQKVVCIKSEGCNLNKNEIYTIRYVILSGEGLILEEIDPDVDCIGYKAERFRVIDSDWADEVLSKIESQELLEV